MPRWDVQFDMKIDTASPELVQLVAEAGALARVIRGIPIPPYLRERLDQLNILRAVRGTTGIEGSDLSEDEVGAVLGHTQEGPVLPRARQREEQEVRNAARVMRMVSQLLVDDPATQLTERLIATIHEMTTTGISYENNSPGVYRSHGVRAGTYVPPDDHERIVDLMKEFVRWVNGEATRALPPVVRALAAHFYFISIHPFGDGNGRTARAIESFLLYQSRVNVLGFYSLSNFYYRRRPEYIRALDDARFRSGNNLTPFVVFGLRGLVEELSAVHEEVLDAVAEIAFRDLANEQLLHDHRLERKVRERLYALLVASLQPIRTADVNEGRHVLSAQYSRLSSKTLARDIAALKRRNLVTTHRGVVTANLDLMREFMP